MTFKQHALPACHINHEGIGLAKLKNGQCERNDRKRR